MSDLESMESPRYQQNNMMPQAPQAYNQHQVIHGQQQQQFSKYQHTNTYHNNHEQIDTENNIDNENEMLEEDDDILEDDEQIQYDFKTQNSNENNPPHTEGNNTEYCNTERYQRKQQNNINENNLTQKNFMPNNQDLESKMSEQLEGGDSIIDFDLQSQSQVSQQSKSLKPNNNIIIEQPAQSNQKQQNNHSRMQSKHKNGSQMKHQQSLQLQENNPSVNEFNSQNQQNPKTMILDGQDDLDSLKPQSLRKMQSAMTNEKYKNNFFANQIKVRGGFSTMTKKRAIPANNLLVQDTPNGEENHEMQNSFNKIDNHNQYHSKGGTNRMNGKLINELDQIEQHEMFRMTMEQFLIEFNKKPQQGINFALEKHLCADNPKEIAEFLIQTEGISKYQLGQYFGSNKAINQQIMAAYFQLLDFKDVEFHQGIRNLLARFRLPGEADQISRVVEQFGKAYMNDNPNAFSHEDVPYILTYAAIMVNVDAHNDTIKPERKMKKELFVKNNMACLSKKEYNFKDAKFLGDLYDQIVQNKLETRVDAIEKGLEKIMINEQFNDSVMKDKQIQNIEKTLKEQNHNFLKYGRQGKPHPRTVYLNDLADAIIWKDSGNSSEAPRLLKIDDITDLVMGSQSTEVFKKHQVPIELDQHCFSIIAKNRTLDLQIGDKDMKNKWCFYLFERLKAKRLKVTQQINKKRRKQINREKISEIWKVDIFPYWDSHWDYEIDKPKNFQNQNNSIISKICPCIFKSKKKQSKDQLDQVMVSQRTDNFRGNAMSETQKLSSQEGGLLGQYEKFNKKKSMLLISLWKIGIPAWARSTIWPLAIGNRLEITEQLYVNLLHQVQRAHQIASQSQQGKKEVMYTESEVNQYQQLQEIEQEIAKLKGFEENEPENNNNQNTQNLLPENIEQTKVLIKNILSAFIFYRPDVGYVKNSMIRLVYMLLQYLDEFTAFSCFVNLLHSYHFLSFFRGDMREIEWRVRFFEKHFQKQYTLVYNHFQAIDLSTEVYLMHWFLSLFANSFNKLEFLARIWDNFFLEGEVFPFKVGMALISFFQLELKMTSFEEAVSILKNVPDIISEEHLFELIENIDISWHDYQNSLQQQKIAQLNPLIHQVLLN